MVVRLLFSWHSLFGKRHRNSPEYWLTRTRCSVIMMVTNCKILQRFSKPIFHFPQFFLVVEPRGSIAARALFRPSSLLSILPSTNPRDQVCRKWLPTCQFLHHSFDSPVDGSMSLSVLLPAGTFSSLRPLWSLSKSSLAMSS